MHYQVVGIGKLHRSFVHQQWGFEQCPCDLNVEDHCVCPRSAKNWASEQMSSQKPSSYPGSSKKTTTHTYMVLWSCSRPPAPQLNVGHSGCTRRPSKKTTILVTGASHDNLLQHWVGGAGGAAIALLAVDVVVFFEEPGGQENASAASVCLRGVKIVTQLPRC